MNNALVALLFLTFHQYAFCLAQKRLCKEIHLFGHTCAYAWWAQMHHFASVCLYVAFFLGLSLDFILYIIQYTCRLPATRPREILGFVAGSLYIGRGPLLWQSGLIANVKLHFFRLSACFFTDSGGMPVWMLSFSLTFNYAHNCTCSSICLLPNICMPYQ